jgi:hypothetical protein
MYSRFLAEAGRDEAALAGETAAEWTALAGELLAASEEESASAARWRGIGERAEAILELEDRLWRSLAG